MGIKGNGLEMKPSLADAGQIEEVIDNLRFEFDLFADHGQFLAGAGGKTIIAL